LPAPIMFALRPVRQMHSQSEFSRPHGYLKINAREPHLGQSPRSVSSWHAEGACSTRSGEVAKAGTADAVQLTPLRHLTPSWPVPWEPRFLLRNSDQASVLTKPSSCVHRKFTTGDTEQLGLANNTLASCRHVAVSHDPTLISQGRPDSLRCFLK